MRSFRKYLKENKLIILDGALGTELQRRGIKTSLPLWSAQALINDPKAVQQIHEDYIKSGAKIITTNTFRTNIRTVNRAKISKTAKELTKKAVKLARNAVKNSGEKIFIAGSIAPVEDCYRLDLVPSDRELKIEHTALARYLKEAGVDLILVETMNTLREALIASRAAKETGLPVFVSFVTGKNGQILGGEKLKDALKSLEKIKIDGFLINCVPLEYSIKPLRELLNSTKLPIGIYANGDGGPDDNQGWKFDNQKREDKYIRYVKKWGRMGVKIIGGCCGTTPEYIKRISQFRDTGT